MSTLRKLVPLALLISASAWPQSGQPSSQESDSKPQTTQSSLPPGPDKKTSPDQTSSPALADSTKLEPIKIVKAKYSGEAREKRLQGEVAVKVVVSETGDVESAEVVSGDPILAESALDAAKKWKFKPFIRNGKAVKASTKLPFDFAFSDKVEDTNAQPTPDNDAKVVRGEDAKAKPAIDNDPKPVRVEDAKTKLATVPVRVAAGVTQGLLVHKVDPVYPPEAQTVRIQGVVVLRAVIAKDGRVRDLSVVSGHPLLAPAAIGAVQQWRYKPYLLNGQPVEVSTEVLVNFKLR
jgi:TonB family protein